MSEADSGEVEDAHAGIAEFQDALGQENQADGEAKRQKLLAGPVAGKKKKRASSSDGYQRSRH
jgi:hypothetical protein